MATIGIVDYRYITEDDLMRFMPEEDAIRALPLFDGAMETGKITKKALKTWVVCAPCCQTCLCALTFVVLIIALQFSLGFGIFFPGSSIK